MLQLHNLSSGYGNLTVLREVSLKIQEKEIVCCIGPNGAGKTTLLKTIMGLLTPSCGEIQFKKKSLLKLSTRDRVRDGVALVPEGRRIFPRLSVQDNLALGTYAVPATRKKESFFGEEFIFHLFPILQERKYQLAGTLSGGEQQMLAIARALMAQPKLLLLDEPSLGLAPVLVRTLFETLHKINQQGTTLLLIEQNAAMALELAHRGYVLESGRIVLEGSSKELKNNPQVRHAYLGK